MGKKPLIIVHNRLPTFFAFFSAATLMMLLERRTLVRPTLLLLTLSVDDTLST